MNKKIKKTKFPKVHIYNGCSGWDEKADSIVKET
jgi:hypothetical protein